MAQVLIKSSAHILLEKVKTEYITNAENIKEQSSVCSSRKTEPSPLGSVIVVHFVLEKNLTWFYFIQNMSDRLSDLQIIF